MANTKVMYNKTKVYGGAEEFQFEEIHAAKYCAMIKQGAPLTKDINRLKREQRRALEAPSKFTGVHKYPKDKVYAYEGEFQPEELMARLYYKRGNRLRLPKVLKASKPTPVLQAHEQSAAVTADNPSAAKDSSAHDAGNITLRARDKAFK